MNSDRRLPDRESRRSSPRYSRTAQVSPGGVSLQLKGGVACVLTGSMLDCQHVINMEIVFVAKNLASLGDLLPDTDLRCRVKGCNNLWSLEGEQILDALAAPKGQLPERMCSSCFETFKSLQDQEVQCAKPGCDKTWIWTRFQQLEAHARGFSTPPKRLCGDCEKAKEKIEAREMPCRIKGCDHTWTWSAERQMTWNKDRPPQRLCDRCYSRMRELKDRQVECRMRGCHNTWDWSAYRQVQHEMGGKSLEKPPRRLCGKCFAKLNTLEDQEITCKVPQCNRRWTYNRFAQLENLLKNGAIDPPPERMCNPCFEFYKRTRERQRHCCIRGCHNTWVYTREDQLKNWLAGHGKPVGRMCEECREKLREYQPRPVSCAVPGCEGTWIYQPEDQLRDARLKRVEPAPKRCKDCEEFLSKHNAETLACRSCGKAIIWSAYEQLLVKHGDFEKPSLCPECAGKELTPHTETKTVPEEHHLVVRMPAGGKWGSDPAIAKWPVHLNHDILGKAEQADIRIVAFGDEMTCGNNAHNDSWPFLLEQKLNAELADQGLTVAVIDAGIAGTTSEQGLVRLPRDVWPFKPHLTLLSFTCSDAWISPSQRGDKWHERLPLDKAEKSTAELFHKLTQNTRAVIYWTPPPIFPLELAQPGNNNNHSKSWAEAQQFRRNTIQSTTIRLCHKNNIPVLDLQARFEVNGARSARKWMRDWYLPNNSGNRNIARWIADYLLADQDIMALTDLRLRQ